MPRRAYRPVRSEGQLLIAHAPRARDHRPQRPAHDEAGTRRGEAEKEMSVDRGGRVAFDGHGFLTRESNSRASGNTKTARITPAGTGWSRKRESTLFHKKSTTTSVRWRTMVWRSSCSSCMETECIPRRPGGCRIQSCPL